jgi:hypothetical protein
MLEFDMMIAFVIVVPGDLCRVIALAQKTGLALVALFVRDIHIVEDDGRDEYIGQKHCCHYEIVYLIIFSKTVVPDTYKNNHKPNVVSCRNVIYWKLRVAVFG